MVSLLKLFLSIKYYSVFAEILSFTNRLIYLGVSNSSSKSIHIGQYVVRSPIYSSRQQWPHSHVLPVGRSLNDLFTSAFAQGLIACIAMKTNSNTNHEGRIGLILETQIFWEELSIASAGKINF